MKKVFLFTLAIVCLLVTSCSDDDDSLNTISFKFQEYTLGYQNPLDVSITLTAPATEDFDVPFTIGGTAKENEEYVISAKKFSFKKGESKATITLTHKTNFSKDKDVIINLSAVDGYGFGDHKTAVISIGQSEKYKYTFKKGTYSLARTIEVQVDVTDMSGNSLDLTEDLHIPFKIDEASTAKKGEHFKVEGLVDDKMEFVLPAGERTAKLIFKVLSYKEDHKSFKIVPTVNENMFAMGKYDQAEVVMTPTIGTRMAGKWVGKSYESEEYLKELVFWYHKHDADNVPRNISSTDEIEIDLSGELPALKVNANGDLKNYLRNCSLTFVKDITDFKYFETQAGINPPDSYPVEEYKMSVCNVAFSATTVNESEAKIVFNIREEKGEEVLDMVITEYAPTDFLVESLKDCLGYSDGPYLDESYHMRYTFSRKK